MEKVNTPTSRNHKYLSTVHPSVTIERPHIDMHNGYVCHDFKASIICSSTLSQKPTSTCMFVILKTMISHAV